MNTSLLRLSVCILVTAAPSRAQGDAASLLEFELRSSGTTVPLKSTQMKQGTPAKRESFSSRVRVSLRRDSIATLNLETGEETLLDPRREEIVILDHKNKRVRVAYLLGWVAALDQEKANRVRIAQAMEAAGVEDPALVTFWIESLFQSGTEAAGEVTAAEKDGGYEFTREKEVVVAFTPGDIAIPAPLRPGWKLFLIRTMGIHPSIRAQLVALDALPRRIRCRSLNVGRQTDTEYEFRAWPPQGEEAPAVSIVDSAEARTTYSAWVDPEDPLDVLLEDIAAKRIVTEPTSNEKYEAQVKALVKSNQHLSAFLVLLESRFAYPDMPVQELASTIQMRGKRVAPFLNILRAGDSNPAAAERALGAMSREGLQGTATIDILRANALTALQRADEAQALFLAVLRARPWLSGPWKDLGDLYARRYRMPEAWRCWEFALKLAPDHPIVRPFADVRKDVRARYADWLGN